MKIIYALTAAFALTPGATGMAGRVPSKSPTTEPAEKVHVSSQMAESAVPQQAAFAFMKARLGITAVDVSADGSTDVVEVKHDGVSPETRVLYDGETKTGTFKNGNIDGPNGIVIAANGVKLEGLFENGALKSGIVTSPDGGVTRFLNFTQI
jgi:hypothetical protein